MRITFLFLLISNLAFGQLKGFFRISSGDSIHFDNPSYTHKVARSGSSYTALITVPLNYSIPNWEIIDHYTRSVVASGTSFKVPYSFVYGTGRNIYDLSVITTSMGGFVTLPRCYIAEFTCLPALFTEATADRVYDLATTGMGFHDDNWVDHSTGYKIWVKNSNSTPNYFYLDDFKSSVNDKPVHIIFDNVTMYSTASANFYLGPTQNVIIDGAKDETVPYGIKLIRNTAGTQDQNFIWYVTGNNGHDHPSFRTIICGISTSNVDHTIGGSAGIQIAPNNTATYNRDTYVNDQVTLFHCQTNWTSGEGYYINHFNDAVFGSFSYSGISNGIFYDLKTYNSANEGFQISTCFGCEVLRNRWVNTGVGNGVGQRNIFQSVGNRDLAVYQNYGETSKDIITAFTGLRGKNIELFSNVFYSTGPSASDGVNVFIKQQQNDVYATEYWGIYNNDFVMAGVSGTGIPFSLYNDTGSPTTLFDSLAIADNIVVTSTATTYEIVSGFNTTNLYVNNYQVTNSALPGFVSFAGKNLDLAASSSPAFRSLSTFVKRHWASAYDCQGYAFLAGHPVVGAYSGAKLFTH